MPIQLFTKPLITHFSPVSVVISSHLGQIFSMHCSKIPANYVLNLGQKTYILSQQKHGAEMYLFL
jgi:hypothetical protein